MLHSTHVSEGSLRPDPRAQEAQRQAGAGPEASAGLGRLPLPLPLPGAGGPTPGCTPPPAALRGGKADRHAWGQSRVGVALHQGSTHPPGTIMAYR